MLVMTCVFPLISLYWAYTMPAAVGFYWIISSLTSWAQSVVTNKYFSAAHMTAMTEAQRAVTLELAEANVRPLSAEAQKQIADRLAAGTQKKAGKGRRKAAKAGFKKEKRQVRAEMTRALI